MYITHEDEKHEIMIGEAAISLLFNQKNITVHTLIDELKIMSNHEEDDERLLAIWTARKWLLTRRKSSYPEMAKQSWLMASSRQTGNAHTPHEETISLNRPKHDE